MSDYGLSKSRLMDALQCPKLLWVRVHEPERIVFGADTQRMFAMGHQVGAVAQSLHPGGVLIGGAERGRLTSADLRSALGETRDLLAGSSDDLALFEATFEHDGVLVCGDCRFTEVKATPRSKTITRGTPPSRPGSCSGRGTGSTASSRSTEFAAGVTLQRANPSRSDCIRPGRCRESACSESVPYRHSFF